MMPADLSNSALDAAFANSWDIRDYASANIYGEEIRRRLVDVSSFIWGLAGMSEFPLYDKRISNAGGYAQVEAARSSVSDAIANAPATIVNVAGDVAQEAGKFGKSVFEAVSPFVWGAIVVGGIAVYAALRK